MFVILINNVERMLYTDLNLHCATCNLNIIVILIAQIFILSIYSQVTKRRQNMHEQNKTWLVIKNV